VSVYDELAGHGAAVLGEVDSGAELIITGTLYRYFYTILHTAYVKQTVRLG